MIRIPPLLVFLASFALIVACQHPTPSTPAPAPPASTAPPIAPVIDASPLAVVPVPVGVDAGTPPPIRLRRRGVNISGAEFAGSTKLPGKEGVDFMWPTPAMIDFYVDRGFNHFRLPFMWERLQPTLQGPIDEPQAARMKTTIDYATKRGATVLLDPQNNFRHRGVVVSEVQIGDFWGRIAQRYVSNPLVQIGVTNEPNGIPSEKVASLNQAALTEIRRVGFKGLVSMPGDGWAGAGHWTEKFDGHTPSSVAMKAIKDPGGGDVAYEIHLYLDADASGAGNDCVSPTIGAERMKAFVADIRAQHKIGVLAEIGAPATDTCKAAVANALRVVEDNYDLFDSWAWWGAGSWSFGTWSQTGGPQSYKLSIGPAKAGPQLVWLEALLPCHPPDRFGADGGAP